MPEPGARDIALLSLVNQGAGTVNSADVFEGDTRGVQLVVTLANVSGTISVVVKIQGKDIASGAYYDILATPALVAAGVTRIIVYPDVTAAANSRLNEPMPPTWRVQMVSGAGATPKFDITVGASTLL
jgi:hypothetical protein